MRTRFDVSPAWQAFVGAEPALAMFASLDPHELHDHAAGLAAEFRERMGLPTPERAERDRHVGRPRGLRPRAPHRAGITASGRAGRARVAFHLFNDDEDVDLALAALGR